MAAYRPPILEWQEIAPRYRESLLLGNGGSIAVHPGFAYASLYEAALAGGYVTAPVAQVFAGFDTHDFELVLRRLWHATLVNRALLLPEGPVETAYRDVRDALIRTVRDTHVTYDDALPHLQHIYRFMQQFRTVICLNYDLIAYWAAMLGNEQIGNWFKDAFHGPLFNADWRRYRQPYGAPGATLLFYPHGNLVLAQTASENEVKIHAGHGRDLLSTITDRWTDGRSVPLFVCEGTAAQKQQAIRVSRYLDTVATGPMREPVESLVIYGWSMGGQDEHILAAIHEARPARLAVSVHGGDRNFVDRSLFHLQGITDRIEFFDSASAGCWNMPA